MDIAKIVGVLVAPSIGIARVGNSPESFFIGPEAPGCIPEPEGGFKDARGRVKRQAARFRVYGIDAQGQVLGEITAALAEIEWTVQLVNRKAEWYQFEDRYHFLPQPPDVNPDYDPSYPPIKPPGTFTARRNATVQDRASLVIDPGPRTIRGRSCRGARYRFDSGKFRGHPVPLGELQTDAAGRLLVLGGFGHSASIRPNNPLTTSFNNDDWFDDTSDGPVSARVQLPDGRSLQARPARVLVTPPKFAPAVAPIVSLFDRVAPASRDAGLLPARVSFTRDVYPILRHAADMRWVSVAAHRGHGPGVGGDFLNPSLLPHLASNAPADQRYRAGVFARVRNPNLPLASEGAKAQASLAFMPPLGGDASGPTTGDPRTFLHVATHQYAVLERWAKGDFDADFPARGAPGPRSLGEYPAHEQPRALLLGALEPSVGGGFHPGIEMTYICEHSSLYEAPNVFRSDLEPGAITKYMALPWQGDFYSCEQWWWPSQRPEAVIEASTFDRIVRQEVSGGGTMGEPTTAEVVFGPGGADNLDPKERADAALAERVPWERGLEGYFDQPLPGVTPASRLVMMQMENAMVDLWSDLGFVTPTRLAGGEVVQVERSRSPLVGVNARELYYRLQNVESYPEAREHARWFVEHYLSRAKELEHDPNFPDAWHSFDYTPETFAARLQQIYNDLVIEGEHYDPATDPLFKTREDVIYLLTQMAPFNQNDGAWIHRSTPAGPLSEVDSLLFSVWMDEAGDGNNVQAHGNLYTNLLHSIGVTFPDVRSNAYANDPRFLDSAFVGPALALAAAQFPSTFYPEILGFSLQIEWTVLGIRPAARLLEYFDINPLYYVLHIGIDNAAAGHGYRVRRAIELYLDDQRQHGGEEAVQEQFRRIWNGFVCFGTAGSLGEDVKSYLTNRPQPPDLVAQIIQAKQPFGSLNHGTKAIGPNRINDWFEDPAGFMAALVSAGYIVAGDVEGSPFFQLTSFNGPMFGVFTDEELEQFRSWTLWLASPPPPPPIDSGAAMARVIETLAPRQVNAGAHQTHLLAGISPLAPHEVVKKPVAWWFAQTGEPAGVLALMRALSDPAQGWIVPRNPSASPFITELLSEQGAMGRAFANVAPGSEPLTMREVALRWVSEGCPIPALAVRGTRRRVGLFTAHQRGDRYPRPRILGMGNVH